ncbi:MAG: ABC transporter ATP-binding protein [Turicibacter sp.]|nr:ABC transporter ATP-binding protein [Turicibacter sp.]
MIEFKQIEIKYGDFIAMSNLNLTIKEGEFFTLLGPSGCGKTTTLRSLVGFVTPSSGSILINGEVVNQVPVEKRGISMVFQSYALFPTMNVYDNIAYGLRVQKLGKKEINEKVLDIAKRVDLSMAQLQKKVSELSGGQQQRVAIARALVLQPKILVLDEPLSNLDAKLRHQLRQELKNLQRSFGITTIYVTHDQEEALTLSDRIAVFNNGSIEQVGTPKEIYHHSKTEFVCNFIGDINQIDKEGIKQINQCSSHDLDENKPGFIRLEKVLSVGDLEGQIPVPTKVVDAEFFGLFTKYTYRFGKNLVKNIEKDSHVKSFNVGDDVNLYLNPRHILQY